MRVPKESMASHTVLPNTLMGDRRGDNERVRPPNPSGALSATVVDLLRHEPPPSLHVGYTPSTVCSALIYPPFHVSAGVALILDHLYLFLSVTRENDGKVLCRAVDSDVVSLVTATAWCRL